MANEIPPRTALNYVAGQLDADPDSFRFYARREETRREHIVHLLSYLGKRTATAQDRRAALRSAIDAASQTDKGISIAQAIIATLRDENVLLSAPDTIERLDLAARAIARRRAETALISDLTPKNLQTLDELLKVDPNIRQTRFHWLRSAPEALHAHPERAWTIADLAVEASLSRAAFFSRFDRIVGLKPMEYLFA